MEMRFPDVLCNLTTLVQAVLKLSMLIFEVLAKIVKLLGS